MRCVVLTRQLELQGGARGGAAAEHAAHVVQQARRLREAATQSSRWLRLERSNREPTRSLTYSPTGYGAADS